MVTFPLSRIVLMSLGCALLPFGSAARAADNAPPAPAPASTGTGESGTADKPGPAPDSSAAPSAPAAAAAPSASLVPAKLSVKDCLNLALEHNTDYKHSLVAVANSESRLRATNQLHHMQFDTNLGFTHASDSGNSWLSNFGPSVSVSQPSGAGFTGTALVPGYNSVQEDGHAALEYTLPLIRGRGQGSETRAQLVQARVDTDSTRLQHFQNEQDLIERVVQAYYNAVRAQALLKVALQTVANAETSTTYAEKLLAAGLNTEIEVTRAQLQLSRTRQALNSQQQSYRNALDALVLALGLPVGAQPELTDTIEYIYTPTSESTAVETALQNRPELGLIRLNQTNAEVQLALAESHKKPQADVRFNFSSLGFALLGGGGIAKVLTSLFGLHLSVPVKERTLHENLAQAVRNRDILDEDYEFQRQQIVNEVRNQVRSAETARENIDLLTANLDVAKKSVHIAQRRIEEGLDTNRDLLDAQASQAETESGVLSAKVDYYLTMISLRRAMGLPLREYFGLPPSTGTWLPERNLGRQARIPRVYVDTRRPVLAPTGLITQAGRPVGRERQP